MTMTSMSFNNAKARMMCALSIHIFIDLYGTPVGINVDNKCIL